MKSRASNIYDFGTERSCSLLDPIPGTLSLDIYICEIQSKLKKNLSKLKNNPPTRFKQLTEFPVQNQLPESSLAGFVIPGTLKLNIHLALLNSETKQVQVKNGNIFFFTPKLQMYKLWT